MTVEGNKITASVGMGLTNDMCCHVSTMTEVVLSPSDSIDNWREVPYGVMDGKNIKYSTLSIKRELANLGRWDAAKALMQSSSVWDDYILANYLSETDNVFVAAKTAFVQSGILTQTELDEMLLRCVWTED